MLARLRRSRITYDLDDAEYLRHPAETLEHLLRHSSKVIVGSRGLAAYVQAFNPHVHVLGSPILRPEVTHSPRAARLHLGWIGFFNNHRHSVAELVFAALREVQVPLTLTLLGVDRPAQREAVMAAMAQLPHVELRMPVVADWCDEDVVYREIASWDWGLAPLLDTEFNRAKSAFKLKQCLAAGVPVLASPVGENVGLLTPGVDGFYFASAGELAAHITRLAAQDAQAHACMREQARTRANDFLMEQYASDLYMVLAGLTRI